MGKFSGRSARTHIGVAVVAAVSATAAVSVAADTPSAGESIRACYAKQGGALRFVKAGRKCRKSERSLSWSVRGPVGEPGAAGAPGAAGPAGTKGDTGARGPAGPRGLAGADGRDGINGTAGVDGSARAYAKVNANHTLATAASKGVTSVEDFGTGSYCVFLSPTIDPAQVAAIASPLGGPGDTNTAIFVNAGGCSSGGDTGIQVTVRSLAGDEKNSAFYLSIP